MAEKNIDLALRLAGDAARRGTAQDQAMAGLIFAVLEVAESVRHQTVLLTGFMGNEGVRTVALNG